MREKLQNSKANMKKVRRNDIFGDNLISKRNSISSDTKNPNMI